jgi:glutamate---cysteine ligase / carboxylate-amine ligase
MDYEQSLREARRLRVYPLRANKVAGGEFRFGIEEEYFLADKVTGEIALRTPDGLFTAAHLATEGLTAREFLQSQVEVATRPLHSSANAKCELKYARKVLAYLASAHGLCIQASGTHPTARWQEAVQSSHQRYDKVMDDLQMIGQRNMLCGMHVHVELPDPRRRIDVMRRILPYLPVFLALSTSSPFWHGVPTGLRGYRLAAYDELPRTGIPEVFYSEAEYDAYVAALVDSRIIDDASYLWWMVRPSTKYPTLELRAPDCCTRLEDTIAIAALYRVIVRHLFAHATHNEDVNGVTRAVAVENKWRAQRYGARATFATSDGAQTVQEIVDYLIELTAFDAAALDCEAEVAHCRTIAQHGTSADKQLEIYALHIDDGPDAALRRVIAWLSAATLC